MTTHVKWEVCSRPHNPGCDMIQTTLSMCFRVNLFLEYTYYVSEPSLCLKLGILPIYWVVQIMFYMLPYSVVIWKVTQKSFMHCPIHTQSFLSYAHFFTDFITTNIYIGLSFHELH